MGQIERETGMTERERREAVQVQGQCDESEACGSYRVVRGSLRILERKGDDLAVEDTVGPREDERARGRDAGRDGAAQDSGRDDEDVRALRVAEPDLQILEEAIAVHCCHVSPTLYSSHALSSVSSLTSSVGESERGRSQRWMTGATWTVTAGAGDEVGPATLAIMCCGGAGTKKVWRTMSMPAIVQTHCSLQSMDHSSTDPVADIGAGAGAYG